MHGHAAGDRPWPTAWPFSILAAVAITAAFTFRDYGLGWDDFTHSQYGDLLLKLYGSGFTDKRALSFVNLYKYGGGFDMAAALAAKVLPFGLFETRRLIGAAVGIIGLFATWRLGRRLGGPTRGLDRARAARRLPALLRPHVHEREGRALRHRHGGAAARPGARLRRISAARARARWRSFGVGLGLAFGSRVLAGIAAPCGIAALVLDRRRGRPRQPAGSRPRSGSANSCAACCRRLLLGYLIMGLLWPWSVLSPLNPLRAAEYFDTFFEKPWKELYEGRLIAVPAHAGELPAASVPAQAAGNHAGARPGRRRRRLSSPPLRRGLPVNRRASLLAVALAATLPVALAMLARPALYNGLRHFVFVVPPFAVLGGLAGGWIVERARSYGKAALGALAAVFIGRHRASAQRHGAAASVSIHGISTGSPAACAGRTTVTCSITGASPSNRRRTNCAPASRPPTSSRPRAGAGWWRSAVRSRRRKSSSGPQFETTFDRKTADFAMALGTFYCRHLQAPIMATIEREGVVYAHVYDLRGAPTPKLLTVPPP